VRTLILLLLFAPAMHAIDLKDVDRDTLRYARLALLKDDVRKHFGLRVGDFEALDQAASLKLGTSPLVILRLGRKAAAITITEAGEDRAAAHLFVELEDQFNAEPLFEGRFVAVHCATDGARRTRLLRLHDEKLQLCHEWISAETATLEGGRYSIETTRELAAAPLRLLETTRHLLDARPVEGGLGTRTSSLLETETGLQAGAVTDAGISVTTHCAIARKLERDGLNEAALHHARQALHRCKAEQAPADDARYLESQALVARLEARLRPAVVEK